MKSFRFVHVLSMSLLLSFLWLCPDRVSAATTTIVSNETDWLLSTDNPTDDTAPWPGVASLPGAGTFTLTPVAGAPHVDNVSGATNLLAESGIRFYRTEFALGAFSTLTADLRISGDNDFQIFVNGGELALEGSLDGENFSDGGQHHRLFIDAAGTVTNGFMGGDFFDSFTATFPSSNWNMGTNDVILAIRNLVGDAGGFSFGIDITTTATPGAVPEPATWLLFATGLVSILGYGWRRRKQRV